MKHPRWLLLTGAGVSAESGVPTYRDSTGRWQRKPPVTHQEFFESLTCRQRFWARNFVGWRFISAARPNAAHQTIFKLQELGVISGLVTQNVDGLHQRAGSQGVLDLHGRIDQVSCLNCRKRIHRESIQTWLEQRNPEFLALTGEIAPDGDADIDSLDYSRFRIPNCEDCGGILKPDVVFFGGSVPREIVNASKEMMTAASGLLVVGSSLMTYSGYRFCLWAKSQRKPIGLLCQGTTRADCLASAKAEMSCAPVLKNWLGRIEESPVRVTLSCDR